jgi:hypothetical protein
MAEIIRQNTTSLAAGIALRAVEDLKVLHKKCKRLNAINDKGQLEKHFMKVLESRIVKKNNGRVEIPPTPSELTFSIDEMTALDFFNTGEDANDIHGIVMGLTGITDIPKKIIQQKGYVERTVLGGLRDDLRNANARARRRLKDKYGLCGKNAE